MADKIEEDFTNFVFTCNHVPTEFLDHDDRRFFVIQHDGEHVQDQEYFDNLRRLVVEKKAYAHLFCYLLNRPILNFKKGQAPPQTRLKDRLMTQTVDPIFRYFRFLMEQAEDYPTRLPFKRFFDNALKWCKEERMEGSIKHWKTSSLNLKNTIREQFEDWEV